MRLVLDTNVWIDWLVYDDPSVAQLKAAQRDGQLQIVVDEACFGELTTVLAYPEFEVDDACKARHLAEVVRCTIRHEGQNPAAPVRLPRCRDPDDQKFLVLAQDAAAQWLLTRDKALLSLNRRLRSSGLRIGSPLEWSAACAARA